MIAKGPEGPPSADAIAAAPTVHLCALSRKWHGKLVRLRGEVSPIIDTWDIVDADGLPCGVSFRLDPDIEQRTPETFEKFLNAPDDPPPTVSVVGRLGFHFTIYAIDSVD